MNEQDPKQKTPRTPYHEATDHVLRSVRAWNELLATSTDMAFDVVLRNWNYSRSLRGSAEQAIEDAIKTQQRLSKEMMQAWSDLAQKPDEKDTP
ncbi:hypothetical protein HC891_19375 [Candidatus Gracilibacteria bacterium]|nr:hypothetical protein [Candidatus Gracilibacteria bacterium]